VTGRTQAAVLILGAGSIGTRHALNLLAAGAHVTVADPVEERARAIAGVDVVPFDLDRLEGYDGVVVASPTRYHVEQARAAIAAGARVLVEKPVATTVADALPLAGAAESVMVGYNLRLHSPICRLRQLTEAGAAGAVLSARFWFGSYLPDWRAGVDYRSSYSARADLGGGVLLDAIHELDLATWWFGDRLEVVGAVVGRVSSLDIDVEDSVKALLVTPDGIAVDVSLDYLSRRYRRGIEIVGEDATLRLDWATNAIDIERPAAVETIHDDTPVSRSYELQAERFLSWLRGEAHPEVDGAAALHSVRLADDIRAASR
jgi:hypothetical protein